MQKFRNLAAACACIAIAAAALVVALGSTGARGAGDQPRPLGDKTADDVNRMLGELEQGNIERSIRALAGFGTRHTLSSQTDPNRGIGAARDWIYSELQRSAQRSGGR